MIIYVSIPIVLNIASKIFSRLSDLLGLIKKKSFLHPKACPIKRAAYQSKLDYFMQQCYCIVCMDESGFEYETMCPYGYAMDR